MTNGAKLMLAGLVAALSVGPAYADWQYTKWGMTPQQVITASKGAAHASSGPGGYPGTVEGAAGQFATGDRKFNAVFYFKDNKLSQVYLELTGDGNCEQLLADMEGIYGPPQRDAYQGDAIWIDAKQHNRVFLLYTGICLIQYSEQVPTGAEGL